jgi:hypothetical protein
MNACSPNNLRSDSTYLLNQRQLPNGTSLKSTAQTLAFHNLLNAIR